MGRRILAARVLAPFLASGLGRGALRTRITTLLAAVVFAAPCVAAPGAQRESVADDPCDSRLIPQKGDPLAYTRRGDRCEGLYVLEVAASADLSLVAFTAAVPSFTLKAEDQLHLNWPHVPGKSATRLRAVSLNKQVYYRMDAVRPPGTDKFEWPTDVVAKLNLRNRDVGILGWVQQTLGEKETVVYVPVRVATSPDARATGPYVVQVIVGAEVAEVYVTLTTLGQDGREGKILRGEEPLGYGFYPADRPITVTLSGLPAAGLYRVRLGAVLKTGGAANKSFVFYHPGP
jgi:hypothetical protein